MESLKKNFIRLGAMLVILQLANCGVDGTKSELEVCHDKAMKGFIGCLFNYVYIQENIYHKNIDASPATTEFAKEVCANQYFARMKCPDQKTYRPTRSD